MDLISLRMRTQFSQNVSTLRLNFAAHAALVNQQMRIFSFAQHSPESAAVEAKIRLECINPLQHWPVFFSFRLQILQYPAETEICQIKDDRLIKVEMNINHHGPRPISLD